jgi:predicted heme/steroid binding protein
MRKVIIIVVSVLVAGSLVGGALFLRKNNSKTQASPSPAPAAAKTYTASELGKFDGKDGHDCLVAVDGKVYKIEQGRLWQDGQHTSSEGQASCGRDLSQVITQSPHGKSKLATLPVIGTLK